MAHGRKTGGRDFPKGVSPNPGGRPKLPPEAKEFKRMTQAEVIDLISKVKDMRVEDIEEARGKPETTAMQAWVYAVFLEGIRGGDTTRLNAIWDRVLGKVPQALEHTGARGGPIETRDASATDEQLDAKIARLLGSKEEG